MDTLTDGQLMAVLAAPPTSRNRCRKEQAFEEIYRRYSRTLMQYAETAVRCCFLKNLEAFDLVQEMFAHIFRPEIARQFDQTLPLLPWLRTLLFNKAKDLSRQKKSRQFYASVISIEDRNSDSEMKQLVARDSVQVLLKDLPEEHQLLIQHYYGNEKSAAEVAKVLGWDVGKVYRTAFQLKATLKKRLHRLGYP